MENVYHNNKLNKELIGKPVTNATITENDLNRWLEDCCYKMGLDSANDLLKESQNRFSYVLKYIGKNLENSRWLYKYSSTTLNKQYMYDDNKLMFICDYYLDLCNLYNKIPSIYDYGLLLNSYSINHVLFKDSTSNNNIYINNSSSVSGSYNINNNNLNNINGGISGAYDIGASPLRKLIYEKIVKSTEKKYPRENQWW